MNLRPQVQLRFRGVEQFEATKGLAQAAGVSVNEYILLKLEAVNGDVKRGAEGSERSDHEEVGAAGGGGVGDVRDAGKEAGGLPVSGGEAGMREVRGRIHGRGGKQGQSGKDGAGAVLGSSVRAQRNAGAVVGSAQKDSGGKRSGEVGVLDRVYRTPHSKTCKCGKLSVNPTAGFGNKFARNNREIVCASNVSSD